MLPARTLLRQRAVALHLERTRRRLLVRAVSDALTQATAALAEALLQGGGRAEVWRLAAARTSALLDVLDTGAASLGNPLPPEVVAAIDGLREWAVTACAGSVEPPQFVLVPRGHLAAVVERQGPAFHPPAGS